MRTILFGIIWFILIGLATLLISGFIVGFVAATGDPENAREVGRTAGRVFGEKYGFVILIASFFFSVVGSLFGWLPGTKQK